MNAPFKQAGRLGRLTAAPGPDVLVLRRFDGRDHLTDLFEYRVEALATRDDLDFDELVGTNATVEIGAYDAMRPFDGIVTSARWAGVGENGHRYDLTLRPWFWLAGRRRNQRIFHHKTATQLLQELLSDYAPLDDPALEISLSKDYPTLEYTVQYRESDLDFARRQMERHGISFHSRHDFGSHTLVLTDDVLAHEDIGTRPFKSYDGHHQYEQEHFWDWAPKGNISTGAVRLTDYNFKKPTQAMEVDRLGDAQHAQGQIESFDYPGDYLAQDVGRLVADLRTEQECGGDRRNRAVGDCVSLVAGCVYNGKNDTPYELPKHKTRSTFRTDTHQGEGFNELRFEDERGQEEIYLHAQKDRNEKIENNQTQRVDVNKVESVGHNKSSEIGNNLMQVVDGNMELRVGPANAGTVTPAGSERLVEGIGPRANQIGRPGEGPRGQGNLTVSVERSKVQTIGESHSERVGDRKSINVGASYDLFARQQIHIEADEEIRLTCGPTQITMTGDGNIRVNGRKIFNVASDLIELLADKVKVN